MTPYQFFPYILTYINKAGINVVRVLYSRESLQNHSVEVIYMSIDNKWTDRILSNSSSNSSTLPSFWMIKKTHTHLRSYPIPKHMILFNEQKNDSMIFIQLLEGVGTSFFTLELCCEYIVSLMTCLSESNLVLSLYVVFLLDVCVCRHCARSHQRYRIMETRNAIIEASILRTATLKNCLVWTG